MSEDVAALIARLLERLASAQTSQEIELIEKKLKVLKQYEDPES
jgi:DNA-binding NtrC family response regulator